MPNLSAWLAAATGALLFATSATADMPWPGYQPQLFRWNEDYNAFCARPGDGVFLDLKCVSLDERGDIVSFGAEYRFRVDDYENSNFGLHAGSSFTSIQNRFLAHADLHLGNDVRFFVQLGAASEDGREPFARPGDKGDLDIAQAFGDVRFPVAGGAWRLRIGRQEVAIGRFVAIRDVTNLRRTFDGVRLDGTVGGWSVLALAAEVTRMKSGSFNDDSNPHDRLGVLVFTHAIPNVAGYRLDVVALEHDNDNATYVADAGVERRDTIGARIYGAQNGFDMDGQASYQFGSFRSGGIATHISAWGAAFEGGYTFGDLSWVPRIALRLDIAGGDGKSAGLNTFDLPYPNLSYLTDAGIFAPRNVRDIQPFASANITRDLTATVGCQLLWRDSAHDALYSAANLAVLAPGSKGAFVASQPYVRIAWHPMPLVTIQGTVERAEPGNLLRNSGGHEETYQSVFVTLDY